MKVVICGPPHSGKSCLRYGLKEAIKAIPGSDYPYMITACPDGEGCWYQEAVHQDAELANSLKVNYKGKFTDEWTSYVAGAVMNCKEPLVFIDVGGIPDDKNELICAHATHAIIISGAPDKVQVWRDFCEKVQLRIIAEIHSDYDATSDQTLARNQGGVYHGTVHHLERGDLTIQQRPTVIDLAQLIVSSTQNGE